MFFAAILALSLLAFSAELANADNLMGMCYDPMHNREYPLNGGALGDLAGAMDGDFRQIASTGVQYLRTYFSNFYGIPVAPIAARYGIKLYLGVYMTDESWYSSQVDSAVEAVRNYPNTISAVYVGNENMQPNGPYSADQIIARVAALRQAILQGTGRTVPVGTVQRITELVSSGDAPRLVAACDWIGVNIYPFFGRYNSGQPEAELDAQWQQVISRYGANKVVLTETGYPTAGGSSSSGVPANLDTSKQYFAAVKNNWVGKGKTSGKPAFWFAFYDRRPDDNSMGVEFEKHFGVFTHDRQNKAYPL